MRPKEIDKTIFPISDNVYEAKVDNSVYFLLSVEDDDLKCFL